MKIRKLFMLVTSILFISTSLLAQESEWSFPPLPKPKDGEPKTSTYSQKELLKNWSLSICFAQISKDPENQLDGGRTSSAYLEYGKQPFEEYEKLRQVVKKYINLKYSGSVPSNYDTMKCIDMFYSQDLENAVNEVLKSSYK